MDLSQPWLSSTEKFAIQSGQFDHVLLHRTPRHQLILAPMVACLLQVDLGEYEAYLRQNLLIAAMR